METKWRRARAERRINMQLVMRVALVVGMLVVATVVIQSIVMFAPLRGVVTAAEHIPDGSQSTVECVVGMYGQTTCGVSHKPLGDVFRLTVDVGWFDVKREVSSDEFDACRVGAVFPDCQASPDTRESGS